jgi:hypothetical protein
MSSVIDLSAPSDSDIIILMHTDTEDHTTTSDHLHQLSARITSLSSSTSAQSFPQQPTHPLPRSQSSSRRIGYVYPPLFLCLTRTGDFPFFASLSLYVDLAVAARKDHPRRSSRQSTACTVRSHLSGDVMVRRLSHDGDVCQRRRQQSVVERWLWYARCGTRRGDINVALPARITFQSCTFSKKRRIHATPMLSMRFHRRFSLPCMTSGCAKF